MPDRLLEHFVFGTTGKHSKRGPLSTDDIESCYLRLQPISQVLADNFRRWAIELQKVENEYLVAVTRRIEERVRRMRIKQP